MAQALADLTKLAADENTSPAPEMPEESEP